MFNKIDIDFNSDEIPDNSMDLITVWDDYRAMEFIDEAGRLGSRLGLESMRLLLQELDNPQDKLPVIHVAGTNGKGSICAFLESCYQEAGYRVGRYSSPSLFSYLERFQVNQAAMNQEEFTDCSWIVYKAYRRMKEKELSLPTAFEIETAIAFIYFLEQKVDLVVLETGMGGSGDATNVVKYPLVTVFSSISMDHQQFLGDTLVDIARVKSGIMREGVPVVAALMESEAREVLLAKAQSLNCPVHLPYPSDCQYQLGITTFTYRQETYELSLMGTYQPENAVCALAVFDVLGERFPVSIEQRKEGLKKVCWKGRFELLQTKPVVIRDGAHNADAVKRLVETIKIYFPGKKIRFVMGVFKDKDYGRMAQQILPLCKQVYTVTPPDPERALPKEMLAQCFFSKQKEMGITVPVQCMNSVTEARTAFIKDAQSDEVLIIFGSLSLAVLC